MKKSMSLLDMLEAAAQADLMTKSEFGDIMRNGSFTEKQAAVEAMLAAGGYENLGD